MKVTLLNDTGGNHFGCTLVTKTIKQQLRKRKIKLIQSFPVKTKTFDIPRDTDLIIVNGEGSIHHRKYPQLVKIASQYPSVLINTTWQANPNYRAMRDFLYISVRESRSFNALPSGLKNVEIVPDLTFASSYYDKKFDWSPVNGIGISDNVTEKGKSDGFSALNTPEVFINWMLRHNRLCLGRFHAIVAACKLGIPFSCWKSSTYKIESMMEDIGLPELVFNTREEALDNIPKEFNKKITTYAEDAKVRIHNMFDKIKDIL